MNQLRLNVRKKAIGISFIRITAIAFASIAFVSARVPAQSTVDQKPIKITDGLVILKNEIGSNVKFYSYNSGGTKLEILAVRVKDGTIRTAFNTCQQCNGSPLAFYKQEGNVLVCQNCKTKFRMDMIEQQRGGCNPIPIMAANKIDDGTSIIISGEFIKKNKGLFTKNWKKGI